MNPPKPNLEALRDAILEHNRDLVSELLTNDPALVNMELHDGGASMQLAVRQFDIPMIELLSSKGADPNRRSKEGHQPLYYSLYIHEDVAITKTLLEIGADPNSRCVAVSSNQGMSWLHVAMQSTQAKLAKIFAEMLLDHGADPLAVDGEGRTAFIWAAHRGFREPVMMFLDRGMDPALPVAPKQLSAIEEARNAGHADLADEMLAWKQAQAARDTIDILSKEEAKLRPLVP